MARETSSELRLANNIKLFFENFMHIWRSPCHLVEDFRGSNLSHTAIDYSHALRYSNMFQIMKFPTHHCGTRTYPNANKRHNLRNSELSWNNGAHPIHSLAVFTATKRCYPISAVYTKCSKVVWCNTGRVCDHSEIWLTQPSAEMSRGNPQHKTLL